MLSRNLVCCLVNTICASLKDRSDCAQVERKEYARCKLNLHQVDCLLNIEQDKIDLGRVTPEAALIGAKFLKNVVVLGEFRNNAVKNDSAELAVVVLVRKTHSGGLRNLRGKKYCHPGFKFNQIATDFILKEFENTVLKENNAEGCENNVITETLFEKEIKALSDFFGPSCRPGPWIGFEKYDNDFYKNYSKLCELCNNNDKCRPGNEPFTDSINCLVNGGDVAVTTLDTVYQYFNNTDNKNRIDEFGYLCKSGDINGLENPCMWGQQPWNLIIANKKKESSIKKDIQSWFASNIINKDPNGEPAPSDMNIEYLQPILFPEEKEYNQIQIVEGAPSLLDYLEKYRVIPPTNEKCNEKIRWCTVSNAEQEKCKWLAQASANLAIQPTIKCIQSHNTFACLEDIKTDKVDVVSSDAHFGYIARKKDLAPLAFPDTADNDRIKPIIVIRNTENDINSLKNLEGKKACFPEYGGIEWLSFINTLRAQNVLSHSSCDYGQLISNFVTDSCMPGAHDREHEVSEHIDENKLCKLCQPSEQSKTGVNCNSNTENRFYGNSGALKCLMDKANNGDYAVVTQGAYQDFDSNDFKVLCKNGSVASAPGFNVDENCALTKIIDSEVLAKKVSSKLANIGVVLLNLETHSTQGLSSIQSDSGHINNFVQLFTDVEKCAAIDDDKNNSAATLRFTMLPFAIFLLFIFY
ncbi:hypothetical protein RI129_000247 [Pyrocoelia pectoralis]|uniref:Transferrin n=1 Tax=Pyrocoelia pectoralis TaxID=417401 RepID=A0AAN7VSA2_9COLE